MGYIIAQTRASSIKECRKPVNPGPEDTAAVSWMLDTASAFS
ncbi:hypothetical protein D3OALGA1CA_865 [Olavius algarvensis associated proteobacterium Delta 3]|nr:hypothetical protein D3OALGA1CA_865 [Olavius algarvensis associated proteobacterium Delta 3]